MPPGPVCQRHIQVPAADDALCFYLAASVALEPHAGLRSMPMITKTIIFFAILSKSHQSHFYQLLFLQ